MVEGLRLKRAQDGLSAKEIRKSCEHPSSREAVLGDEGVGQGRNRGDRQRVHLCCCRQTYNLAFKRDWQENGGGAELALFNLSVLINRSDKYQLSPLFVL